jgi:hypothetical protein
MYALPIAVFAVTSCSGPVTAGDEKSDDAHRLEQKVDDSKLSLSATKRSASAIISMAPGTGIATSTSGTGTSVPGINVHHINYRSINAR